MKSTVEIYGMSRLWLYIPTEESTRLTYKHGLNNECMPAWTLYYLRGIS